MQSISIASIWRTALIGIIALGASCPAFAQKAALVQNRDDVARNFYYENVYCGGPSFGYCQLVFSVVPAGKRLIITHVSMLNQMLAPNTISSIDLRYLNGQLQAFLTATLSPATGNGYNYSVNDSVLASYDAGQTPTLLTFSNSPAFQVIGIISGYTVDIP